MWPIDYVQLEFIQLILLRGKIHNNENVIDLFRTTSKLL